MVAARISATAVKVNGRVESCRVVVSRGFVPRAGNDLSEQPDSAFLAAYCLGTFKKSVQGVVLWQIDLNVIDAVH